MTLREAIVLTGSYYGRILERQVLEMYCDDLVNYPTHDVIEAYKAYRTNPKNKSFPLPAQIIEILSPTVSPDFEAQRAAALAFEAISKFGSWDPQKAHAHMGELAWLAVKRMGGWTQVCEMVGVTYERSAFVAHIKQIARSEIEFSHAGRHNEKPMLEHEKKTNEEVSNLNGILKLIDIKKVDK